MKDLFRYTLDLQLFADDDGLIDMEDDGDDDGDDSDALEGLGDFGLDDDTDDPASDDDYADMLENPPAKKEEEPPAEKKEDEPKQEDKPKQDAETNAKFAEERRRKQASELAEQMLQEKPEYKLAQTIAKMYGVDVPTALQRIEQAAIEQEAKSRNVPADRVRQERAEAERIRQLGEQVVQTQYQLWETRVGAEIEGLKQKYPFLTDDDFGQAKSYMLGTLKDPNGHIERAVFALHGAKMFEEMARMQKTEALAEVSGRKKGPLPPQGTAPSATNTLTAEERRIARAMGVSEADYIKYRD